MTQNESNINWDFILDTIRDQKCVLFVGPGLYTNKDGQTIEQRLINYLEVDKNRNVDNYYPEENLFLFSSRAKKTKAFYQIRHFYHEKFPEAENIYRKIAHIPFHLVIKVIPDKLLGQVFQEMNIQYKFAYYWNQQIKDERFPSPSSSYPVIYNLLGCIDTQESMVLTHNDLFTYFATIFQGNSMPDKIKRLILEAKNFIFLGIPFEKWYMQLLLRFLSIHGDYDFVKYAANQRLDFQLKSFCFEQFSIEFIPKQINEFIDELYVHCEQANLLREVDAAHASPIDKFLGWVSKDRIEEVIQEFWTFLESLGQIADDHLDDLILLSSKYNRLEKRKRKGIISSEDAFIQTNSIRIELIRMLKAAKAF